MHYDVLWCFPSKVGILPDLPGNWDVLIILSYHKALSLCIDPVPFLADKGYPSYTAGDYLLDVSSLYAFRPLSCFFNLFDRIEPGNTHDNRFFPPLSLPSSLVRLVVLTSRFPSTN